MNQLPQLDHEYVGLGSSALYHRGEASCLNLFCVHGESLAIVLLFDVFVGPAEVYSIRVAAESF